MAVNEIDVFDFALQQQAHNEHDDSLVTSVLWLAVTAMPKDTASSLHCSLIFCTDNS